MLSIIIAGALYINFKKGRGEGVRGYRPHCLLPHDPSSQRNRNSIKPRSQHSDSRFEGGTNRSYRCIDSFLGSTISNFNHRHRERSRASERASEWADEWTNERVNNFPPHTHRVRRPRSLLNCIAFLESTIFFSFSIAHFIISCN